MSETANPNIGHGHVWKRADGMLARCGGPRICSECRADAMRLKEAAIYKTELDISLLIRAKDEWQSRAQKAEKLTAEIASLRAQLDDARARVKTFEMAIAQLPEMPAIMDERAARRRAIEDAANVVARSVFPLPTDAEIARDGGGIAVMRAAAMARDAIEQQVRALLSESKS